MLFFTLLTLTQIFFKMKQLSNMFNTMSEIILGRTYRTELYENHMFTNDNIFCKCGIITYFISGVSFSNHINNYLGQVELLTFWQWTLPEVKVRISGHRNINQHACYHHHVDLFQHRKTEQYCYKIAFIEDCECLSKVMDGCQICLLVTMRSKDNYALFCARN